MKCQDSIKQKNYSSTRLHGSYSRKTHKNIEPTCKCVCYSVQAFKTTFLFLSFPLYFRFYDIFVFFNYFSLSRAFVIKQSQVNEAQSGTQPTQIFATTKTEMPKKISFQFCQHPVYNLFDLLLYFLPGNLLFEAKSFF